MLFAVLLGPRKAPVELGGEPRLLYLIDCMQNKVSRRVYINGGTRIGIGDLAAWLQKRLTDLTCRLVDLNTELQP